MKTIYESYPNYISPLVKWGVDVSKMRRKAFHSYQKNYDQALCEWPEFREEYDYRMSMEIETNLKRDVKGIKLGFFFSRKNFLKYLFVTNTEATTPSQ